MSITPRPLHLLLVTGEDACAARVGALLDAPGLARVAGLDEAVRHLAGAAVDCVLLDLEPDANGTDDVKRVLEAAPQTSVVVLTTHTGDELPVRLIRAGAHEFFVRDSADGDALMRAVRCAVERRRTSERLDVERHVRDVAAEVRASPRRRRDRALVLGVAAVIAAVCVQLAVLQDVGGVALGLLFAVAAIVAWRATSARRDGARLLQSIMEGSTDGVVVKDIEGRHLLVNDAATWLLDLPADIVGRTDAELFDAEEAAVRRDRDEAVLAAGEARRYWRTVADRTLSIVTTPRRDDRGDVIGLIETVRDETALRRLEEETSRFFELSPDMLCTAGATGRLERVNGAWTTVLGWSADELRSQPVLDFVHPADRERAGREIELMLSGDIDGCANRLATRAGGWRDVEWTARVVPDDDRAYAFVRDVTDRNAMQAALATSQARYRTLVQSMPNAAVLTFDHDLRFTFAAGEAIAQAELDGSFVGRTLDEAFPDIAPELMPRYRAALGGHSQSFEFAGPDGVVFWVQVAPLRDGAGAIDGGLVFTQDITALKAAERELMEAEERFRTAFDQAPIGMGLVSLEGRYLRVNAALCELMGYNAERLLETGVDIATHPDDVAADIAGRADLVAGTISIFRTEKRYVHPDGREVWVSVHATLVRDADGNPSHILGQIQDITDRRRYEDRLQHLVDHDSLTGLFNRRRFGQELERHVAHTARYGAVGALLVLDLDDFKSVNDTLGHHAGDELIIAVAALLRARLRETDVVARLGGDEFAILLPAGTVDEAEAVAGKLVLAVREETGLLSAPDARPITASVGLAAFPAAGATADDVLVNADFAMYQAKQAGRDRHAVYDPGT